MENNKLKVLVDTNIAITYLSGREDKYSNECATIMKHFAEGRMFGYIAQHSISTIWYYTRRLPNDIRREWLKNLCVTLTVVGISHKGIMEAIERNDFSDFEDCIIDECAIETECNYIVTANINDFLHSSIPAVLPNILLEKINNK